MDHKAEVTEGLLAAVDYRPPVLSAYPRGQVAPNCSIAGLTISWILGIGALSAGSYYTAQSYGDEAGWMEVKLNRYLKEVLPLLINVIITVLEYALGFVHSVALRWALGDRLTFNSNLRLFSYPRGYLSLGFLSNFLNGGLLVLTYTATSFLFSDLPIPEACRKTNDLTIDLDCTKPSSYFSPSALLCIGIGLVGQAFLSTCQLRAVKILSWDAGSIPTAWTMVATGRKFRQPNRGMMSVHDSTIPTGPRLPIRRQRMLLTANKEARRVVIYLWVVVILCLVWFIVMYIVVPKCDASINCISDAAVGTSWSLIPDSGGLTSLFQIDFVDPDNTDGAFYTGLGIGLTIATLMGFQAMLTMALHCAELLVNASRDEDVWRSASSRSGYKDVNPIVSTLKSWEAMLLFASKPVVHWLFGLAITFYYGWGIFMRPPQILYLTLGMFMVAVYGTIICTRRPSGYQPCAYGHLQTLVNLIDVYDLHFYWGDKGIRMDPRFQDAGLRFAGTWGDTLQSIQAESLYL